jgi:hypothetical protein
MALCHLGLFSQDTKGLYLMVGKIKQEPRNFAQTHRRNFFLQFSRFIFVRR